MGTASARRVLLQHCSHKARRMRKFSFQDKIRQDFRDDVICNVKKKKTFFLLHALTYNSHVSNSIHTINTFAHQL